MVIMGPTRHPINVRTEQSGAIHDEQVARAHGLAAAPVAGTVHMDVFPPVLLQAFGQQWFERGSLSLRFLETTADREPVRAAVDTPPETADNAQVATWLERPDGRRVAEGTASMGDPDAPSALRSIDLRQVDPQELVILSSLRAGTALSEVACRTPVAAQRAYIQAGYLAEPLDWYTSRSPWGPPILTPRHAVELLFRGPLTTLGPVVQSQRGGMFGAIELRYHHGPLLADVGYRVDGQVIALSRSPRSEILWLETAARRDGTLVASLRLQLRVLTGEPRPVAALRPTASDA